MRGLDYSAGVIPGGVIRAAGFDMVIRYVGTPGRTKNITKAEYNDLLAHGVTVHLVYENNTNDAMGGFAGGQAAARAARADADHIGYPGDGVIFFCSDRHLAQSEIPTALSYIDGASDVLGKQCVGVYGFWEFVDAAIAGGHGSYYWQCGIAPDASDPVHLWQRNATPATTTVGGIQCDLNEVLRPIPVGGGGGTDDMMLSDGWTDPAGNHQDVQTTLDRVNFIWHEFFDPGTEASRIPGDGNVTNLRDALMDTTAKTAIAKAEIEDLHRKVDNVTASLAAVQAPAAPAVDLDALAAKVAAVMGDSLAAKVADELAKRLVN